jgi:hypothetical protein
VPVGAAFVFKTHATRENTCPKKREKHIAMHYPLSHLYNHIDQI